MSNGPQTVDPRVRAFRIARAHAAAYNAARIALVRASLVDFPLATALCSTPLHTNRRARRAAAALARRSAARAA